MAHVHHDAGLCWEWDSVLLLSNPCSLNSPGLETDGRHDSGVLRKSVDSARVSSFCQQSEASHDKSPSHEASATQTSKRDPRLDCPNFLAGRVPCACTDNDDDDTGGSRKRSKPVPRCQIAACGAELTGLKGYHQRHRVCLRCAHATRVMLREKPHRYCQQCGKFHPICDFDEGKRSCRRKLERHNNRRRRKDGEDGLQAFDSADTEILNETSPGDGPSNVTNSEVLNEGELKFLSQQEKSSDSGQTPGISLNGKVNQIPQVSDKSIFSEDIGNDDRLQALKPSTEMTVEENVPRSCSSANSEEVVQHSEIQFVEERAQPLAEQLPVNAEPHRSVFHNIRAEDFPSHTSGSLGLGGLAQKRGGDPDYLLDLLLEGDGVTDDSRHLDRESDHLLSNRTQHWASSTSPRKLSKETAYSSPLPTGRISFKLYDWNPGDFPRKLRQQVMEWLSNMPVDLEGYIRSGCTILTIFVAMPQLGWDELDADWAGSVLKLVQAEEGICRFWRSGYLVARMDDHVVHIKNGELAQSCCNEPSSPPVLLRVHPLCLEEGLEQEVVIQGHNIRQPNLRLLVSFDGKYIINDEYQFDMEGARNGETASACDTDNCEDAMLLVHMPALHSTNCGTAYVEVEHMSGTSNYIPLLVAEKPIVDEVRSLEMEMDGPVSHHSPSIDESPGFAYRQRRVHNFLLDLGWALRNISLKTMESGFHEDILELHLDRLRRILFFGVERSWCNVVRRVLELASQAGVIEKIGVLENGMSAIQVAVLHQKVAMIEHLISCAESLCASNHGTFWWNLSFPGPGGLTALHMVALQPGAQDLLDTVMKRKYTVSLWNCLHDNHGRTPEYYMISGIKLSRRIEIQGLVEMIASRLVGDRTSLLPSLPHPAGKAIVWSVTQNAVAGATNGSFHSPNGSFSYKGLNMYINKGRQGNLNLRSSVSLLLVCAALCVILQRPNQVIVLALSLRRSLWGLENGSE